MLKLLSLSLLLLSPLLTFAQFNTVRRARVLAQVQADTGVPSPAAGATAASAPAASMPLALPLINSPYGQRTDPVTGEAAYHMGIDFRARRDSVLAIMPGKVKKVGYSKGLGNYIEVEHGPYRSVYGHLSTILVKESAEVSAGTAIAITGSTGRSTGEHLHFAIKYRGRTVDPTPYLDLIYRSLPD